jgi:hypothetical protein
MFFSYTPTVLSDEKNVNDYLTKNRRYIMKDYSLFDLKLRQRLEQSTIY